ncbi:BTB/POZ domain-containing protein [Sesamum angolense]|uniref:BTB/POZ domain-containing protein n=1 Tax=Sesamum angolense TaxID=2727404 RepID=A0AAE1W5T7_9LAMI|nr:BTB/POZ domain-containing protein [Sesamum angolense]
MRRHHHRRRRFSSDSDIDSGEDEDDNEDDDEEEEEGEEGSAAVRRRRRMKCLSCKEEYGDRAAGTCRECYEEAGETEEELKREIDELKSKVNFLRLLSVGPGPVNCVTRPNTPCFTDVILVASGSTDSADSSCNSPSIPAHRAILTSRSPVFRAMLENEMEESISGTIRISDVSFDALRAFVNYLYTAEACLDEQMACDLLILAEKYQVKHLKAYCEKYLMSRLNWENSLPYYAFAYQHSAKSLLDAALSLIMDNMDKLSKQEEYMELVEKDPRMVVEIYEAYLSKQVNTAASKDSITKV